MSEHIKSELEENQSCCNSIDLLSKEDGSIVAQITECEEDELSDIQRANASEIVRRWNSQPDLLTDCEKLVSLLSSVAHQGDDKRWWQTLEKSKRDIAKAQPKQSGEVK